MNARTVVAFLFTSLAAQAAETAAGVGTPPSAAVGATANAALGAPAMVQPLAASSSADADAPLTAPKAIHAHDDESLMRLKETPPETAFGILALEALIEATAESDTETRAAEAQPEQGRSTEALAPRAESGTKPKPPPQAR